MKFYFQHLVDRNVGEIYKASMWMSSGIGTTMAQLMVPVIIGENYNIWNIKVQTLLLSPGLWDLIDHDFTVTTTDLPSQLIEI